MAPPQAPAQLEGHTDEDHEHETPPPVPVWDDSSRDAALDAAQRAMSAFARPDVPADRWWGDLQPLLTPAATIAYQGTDPTNVPVRSVTGPPSLTDASTPYLARVTVPTDGGDFVVLLARHGAAEPWLVERMTSAASP